MKLWRSEREPLVTAVTIVYNKFEMCSRAVTSFHNNNGLNPQDLRYILYDNSSPYPHVRWWLDGAIGEVWGHNKNMGVGKALNEVIENTESAYFFKFDDDCSLGEHTLPAMLMAYQFAHQRGLKLGVLSADVIGVGKSQSIAQEIELLPGFTLQVAPCVGGGAVLIARDILEDVGPWRDDKLYGVEDGDYAARMYEKGYFCAYLKGFYHTSYCRGDEADAEFDAWKLEYHGGETTLPFDAWRKPKIGVRGDML